MLKEYFAKLYKQDRDTFFSEMTCALETGERHFVVTANPETLMIAEGCAEFDALLSRDTTTLLPDGIGVVRAAQRLGYEMHGRVTGVDLSAHLLAEANRLRLCVYLYGATEEVLQALVQKLSVTHPSLVLVGAKNGYDLSREEVLEDAVRQAPDVFLVALGIPEQELLLSRYLPRFEKGILVGVGGTFDVLSGKVRRAPKLFISLGLEWLWRVFSSPKRLRRFCKSNIPFLLKVSRLKKERT